MSDTSISAKVKLHRDKKGLFKSSPAIVLFDNCFLHFYSNDAKEFEVRPGTITMSINKKKCLTFKILPGDTKQFIIKEAIFDWRFYLKYGIVFLVTLLLLYAVIDDIIEGKHFPAGLIGFACGIWALTQVRHEYFYLEEQ
jgi:hypothetical protein